MDEVWDCQLITNAKENKDIIVNPIYEWTDTEIWDYIRQNEIPVNPLYEMGYFRVGCIGCPMGSRHIRLKEFDDFPKYKNNYIHSFDRMIEQRKQQGKPCEWSTGEEVFEWWIGKDQIDGQMRFEFDD